MWALQAWLEVPADLRLWCFHPVGSVFQQVQACCPRGMEGRPLWWGGWALQIVLDCPDAEEPLCPVAEEKLCRLPAGVERVYRQVPGEGWAGMEELAWHRLFPGVVESLDEPDCRSGKWSQDALVRRDGGQAEGLFPCGRRSVVSGLLTAGRAQRSGGVRGAPAPVSASGCSVWQLRSVFWQLQA